MSRQMQVYSLPQQDVVADAAPRVPLVFLCDLQRLGEREQRFQATNHRCFEKHRTLDTAMAPVQNTVHAQMLA